MGYSRSTSTDWKLYSGSKSTKTDDEIFTTTSGIHEDMNPMGVVMREARDSDNNPESTPIIVACDVTGSMGMLAKKLVRKGMATLFTELLDRKPVTDPTIMAMAIGDAVYDRAPLQVGQFESDITASTWLEKVYLEGGGGGNNFESYDLPYYFAAFHTSTDCFEKRNKKGYIFTMGDEETPPATTVNSIKKFIDIGGDGLQVDMPFNRVLEAAMKMYHCFHLIIAEGSHARYRPNIVKEQWNEALGQHAIWLDDYTKMSETIVSIIQITEGEEKDTVVKSWSGDTSMVVANAVKDLDPVTSFDRAMGVVRL